MSETELTEQENVIEPGVYEITNTQYHSSPGISKSGICEILKSPAHYWAKYIDPEREPFKETEAMRIGTAAHKMILEPDDFFNEFTIIPESIASLSKNTKIYKATVLSIRENGMIPFSPDDLIKINKMADAVKSHPTAGQLTNNGKSEQSIYWVDAETGVLCKCRPDYWIPGLAVPDLKTTKDARMDDFSKSCANFDYHIQAAFYCDGVEIVTGEKLPMPFIALEKESQFAIGVYQIDGPHIEFGRVAYQRALEVAARCLETNEWPSYPPEIKVISLPHWKFKKGN